MPVSKLKAYLKAFNIQTPGALEKDDIIQAILDARVRGCGLACFKISAHPRYSKPMDAYLKGMRYVFD